MILSELDLRGLRDNQIGTPLKSGEEVSKWQKECLRIVTGLCLGALGHHQMRTAHNNGKNI
jgi:hypothetical protein